MEPITAEAEDDCAKLWMLVETCGKKKCRVTQSKTQIFLDLFSCF